ncbi:peptidoglycan recognition protein [Streptomyces varsoviensis]|uniref:peptidoglycan recognition protein family protein n=1 Tax=Streptomyces varsoviensis TaxID=67373 RepID=UPI0034052C06
MRPLLASSTAVVCATVLALPLSAPSGAAAARSGVATANAAASAPAPAAGVPGTTRSLPLVPLGTAADRAQGTVEQGLTARRVRPFALLGVVWKDASAELHGRVQVRTRAVRTHAWSRWQDVQNHDDDRPDAGSPEARGRRVQGATAPLWVGDSDGVQVRVRGAKTTGRHGAPAHGKGRHGGASHAALPPGLRVELVDPGADPSPAQRAAHPVPTGEYAASSTVNTQFAPLGATEIGALGKAESEADAAAVEGIGGQVFGEGPFDDGPFDEGDFGDDGIGDRPGHFDGHSDGRAPDDRAPGDGARHDGPGPDGTHHESPSPDGTHKDGPNPDGTSQDGTHQETAKPDGTKPDGTKPDGPRQDGTKPDGTRPEATATPEEDGPRAAEKRRRIGPRPRIVTRSGWGANERLRERRFRYTRTVKAAFVHHSATGNNYRCSQAPRVIRGIYRYHVKSSGWRDIGYNFLIDKCGTIYEGRAGGVAKPVMGAHTLGFNSNSMGIAVLGSFAHANPPAAAVKAVARLTAWKLGLYGANPRGTTRLVSGGGNRFKKGARVKLHVISGHRDGFATECPGTKLYRKLGKARAVSARLQGR